MEHLHIYNGLTLSVKTLGMLVKTHLINDVIAMFGYSFPNLKVYIYKLNLGI